MGLSNVLAIAGFVQSLNIISSVHSKASVSNVSMYANETVKISLSEQDKLKNILNGIDANKNGKSSSNFKAYFESSL